MYVGTLNLATREIGRALAKQHSNSFVWSHQPMTFNPRVRDSPRSTACPTNSVVARTWIMRVRLRAVHCRDDTREERVRNGLARVKGRERSSQDGAKSDGLVFARGRTPIRSFCLLHNQAPWAQSRVHVTRVSRHSRLINARSRSHLNRRNVLSAGDEVASDEKNALLRAI